MTRFLFRLLDWWERRQEQKADAQLKREVDNILARVEELLPEEEKRVDALLARLRREEDR